MKAIEIFLLLLLLSVATPQTLQLFSASTFLTTPSSSLSGSLRGGRTIYIQGVGFPSNPNLLQIYVGNYPCKIAADGVTPTVVSCETTDTQSLIDIKSLTISVISESLYYTVPSTLYSYLNSDTPSISDVFPSASIAGERIHYFGVHRVLNYGDGLRDMGDFNGLYIGGNTCSMFDIVQDTINYNSVTRVQCIQSATQTAGKYNITEHVVAGWAKKQYTMRKASLQNIYYEHTVFPSIQEISPRSGFDTGQRLLIKGTGFSNDPTVIDITVDGVKCDVQSSTFTDLRCLLRGKKQTDSSLLQAQNSTTQQNGYVGGAGFDYQRYDISNLPSASLSTFRTALVNRTSITLIQKKKVMELQTKNIYGAYYGQVFKGYFYAPRSGNYTFRGAGDDQFALFINPSYGTTNGSMTQVISASSDGYSADNYYVSNFSSSFGTPLSLVSGKYYYIQLYHINLEGTGYLKISVQVPNNDTSLPKQTFEVNHFETTFTNDPEILAFTLDGAVSGNFNLSFIRRNPKTLATIYSKEISVSSSANAATFQGALNSFDSYSGYDTSCINATGYDINGNPLPLTSPNKTKTVWIVSITKLRSSTHTSERFTFQIGSLVPVLSQTPTFTQTTINPHSPLINGTFTMDIGGQSIKLFDSVSKSFSLFNIPYNVLDSTLQIALRQIVGFQNVQVVRKGTPQYGSKWIISYYEYNNDVPNITFSGNLLTGGKPGTNPRIGFYQTRKWSQNILFNPVSQDFLFSVGQFPSVIVKINNIPSVCEETDCYYSFISATPQIISQIAASGGFIISASISDPMNRSYSLSDIEATIDKQKCTIVNGTFESFTCSVPNNSYGLPNIKAGSYNLSVFVNGFGYVKIRPNISTLDYDLILTSLDRNSGGTNGGYEIRIFGQGFPSDPKQVRITLCGVQPLILSTESSATTIIAPECANGSQLINYTYNGISRTIPFTYSTPNISSSINSISPSSFSPVKKGVMTIVGSGFGNNASDITIYLANATGKIYLMKVLSVNDTQIRCGIPGGLAGNYKVMVSISGVGDIPPATPSAANFKYQLSILSISPLTGSYYGGTLVTIVGRNFSPDLLENIVSIGDQLNTVCTIQLVNNSIILCRMPPTHPDWTNSTQRVIVTNKIIADSDCPFNNCFYTYKNQSESPSIQILNVTSALSGRQIIQIRGNNFGITNFTNVRVVLENTITGVTTDVSTSFINSTTINFAIPNVESGLYSIRVRFDPIGQTNSLPLTLNMSLSSTSLSGSRKGGIINIAGFGLPSSWPSKLFNILITLNSQPIKIQTISASSSSFKIKVSQTLSSSASYSISLTSPTSQKVTATFTQSSTATPVLTIQNSLSLASGEQNITLNRSSTFSSRSISQLYLYNVLNPNNLYPISNWTYNSTFVKFTQIFFAGKYGIKAYFPDYGWASCAQLISISNSSIYTVENVNVSLFGGQVKVYGSDIGPASIIKVGGFSGSYISSSSNYSIFEVPPLITSEVLNLYPDKFKVQIIKPDNTISDLGNNRKEAFDNLHSSFYSSTNSVCYVGIDAGQNKLVDVRRIRYFPYYKWTIVAKYIKGAIFQGSNNGVNFTTISIIDQTAHAGWNTIEVSQDVKFRFIRFRHSSLSECKLSQLQIYGIVLNDLVASPISDITTDFTLLDGLNTYVFPGALRYLNQSTPVIDSISPNNGTIYGGTTLQFTGHNLDLGQPYVSIDGAQCRINNGSINSTYFSCVTSPRLSLPNQNSFILRIGSQIPLLKDEFLYVMRWSDSRTWGTDLPPVEGDLVYVPKGMTLLVDQSTPRLDGIIVEDGKIIFSDEVDMEIHTNLITVNRGEFRAGTESKPYRKKLTFIMYGSYYGKQQPMFGNKGIGCMQCKFSMYGTPRIKTWTMIASTISAGATSFTVIDDVDWKIGEEIVVASTDFDHNQAEQRRITNIVGRQITVDEPFKYKHFGEIQTYGNGTDRADMRAEVGLLTRNIKMMGDPTSEAGEYGSHLMMAGKSQNGLVSHIAYTEFTHCGQPRIVGRYCMHFHMNGDVPDSYAKGNAVHHSFARVITIHGVHFLHVSENVGYRVKGHNFFVEDGIQTNNLIEKNLAIGSLQSWNMLQSDISVASFWITNPSNNVRDNHAAGGDFYGFWYEIKEHPDGPSATIDVCPIGNPLGESHDNVAHSYKRFGLRIFKLYSREVPCDPIRDDSQADPWLSNPSIQSKYYNYLLYKNGQAGVLAEQTGNLILQNFTIAQSKLAGMQFYRTNLTKQSVQARDIAIIGITTNNPPSDPTALNGARGVIGPRTSNWKMSNIRYYNFPSNTVALQTCSKCDNLLLYTNSGHEYFVRNITFNNFNGSYLFMQGLKRQIIYDTDGSFSINFNNMPKSSGTIVWNFKHLEVEPNCTNATSPNIWDNALVCDQTVIIRKAMFTNLINSNIFNRAPMKIQLLNNQTEIVENHTTLFTQFYSYQGNMQPKKDKPKSYSIPFVAGRIYNAWWLTGLDFTHLALDISKLFTDDQPAILFRFNYTQNRELFEIGHLFNNAINGPFIMQNNSTTLDTNTCRFGDYINDQNYRTLTVCATSRGKIRPNQYLDINGIKCRYLCPSPAGQFVKQNFIRMWSNSTQWPNETMPAPGQNITIPGQWTIMMDSSPVPINFLLVDGDIIIPPNLPQVNITAKGIWIRAGSIQAGIKSQPFPGKINIQLLGNKQDVGFVINQDIAGNKLFVIHGRLELYGIVPTVTWTRAKNIVRRGDTTISVAQSIGDWQIGDQIVIGPSFSSSSQHEKVRIVSIDSSTNNISFFPALNFTHYGAVNVTVNNTVGILDTRAAVGILSRRIKIFSGVDNGWGFQTIVHGFNDGEKLRSGNIILQGVEFYNGGQYDTQNTALKIWNTVGSQLIQITKSSFHNCKSYCLDVSNINNALIQNNVFYHARLLHVRALQLTQFTFKSNLMIAAVKRPTMSPSAQELIACYLTYDPIHNLGVSITQNLCQGSELHGFGFPHIPCNFIDQSPYNDNTAGSTSIGFIFNVIHGQACVGASGIKAYATQIGQIASPPGVQQIIYKHFMIADSGRGVTLRFGKEGDDRTAYFSDSYISAISRPNCTQCYGSDKIDCTNNHGVRMLAVTVNGQHMPGKFGKSYDTICKQEVFDSKAFLDNIIFQNFRHSYSGLPQCSSNVIFKRHPLASDLTGSHHLNNVICNGCTLNATALFTQFRSPSLDWFGGCGKIECTGSNNYLIQDHTGHLLGTPSILLANNSEIGDNTVGCTRIDQINGHHCLRQDLSVLQYENIGPDFNTRIMWPVYLKYDGGSWNSTTNGWRQWDWQGNEPLNRRLGRFISVVQLYKTYNMTFQSEPPGDMRFQFQQKTRQGNPNDWIIIKLYYPRPNSIRIQNKAGQTIKPITLLGNQAENNLNTSICGSNKYFYQNYTIHFVVTADKLCQVRVSLTNSIQLNARIDMNISEFYRIDGKTKFIDRICAVLGITDFSRVKIVAVNSGSVQIVTIIEEATSSNINNSTQENDTSSAAQMAAIQALIATVNENGTLNSSLSLVGLGSILDIQTQIYYTIPTINNPTREESQNEPFKNPSNQNKIMIGLIIGVVVGSTVVIALVFSGFVYCARKRAKIQQMIDFSSHEMQKINAIQQIDSITHFDLKKNNKR